MQPDLSHAAFADDGGDVVVAEGAFYAHPVFQRAELPLSGPLGTERARSFTRRNETAILGITPPKTEATRQRQT